MIHEESSIAMNLIVRENIQECDKKNELDERRFRGSRAARRLSTLATNSSRQLNILRHYRDTFSMDRAQVCVLEQPDQVGFGGLLQRSNGGALETQVCLEILGDFTDQTLEW